MNESILERIQSSAKALKIDLYTAELASYADEKELTPEALEAVCGVFEYLEQKKYDSMVHTMLNEYSVTSEPLNPLHRATHSECRSHPYEKVNPLLRATS